MVLLAAALWMIGWAYRRSQGRENPEAWLRRAAFAAGMLGAGWGFAAAVFFPGSQAEHALISFVVAPSRRRACRSFRRSGGSTPHTARRSCCRSRSSCSRTARSSSAFRRGGPAFVRGLRRHGLAPRQSLQYGVRAAQRLRSALQRQRRGAGATRRATGQPARRASRGAGLWAQAVTFSERAPIAVLELDSRATILDINPAAENLFGYAAPEMVGRNLFTMLLRR